MIRCVSIPRQPHSEATPRVTPRIHLYDHQRDLPETLAITKVPSPGQRRSRTQPRPPRGTWPASDEILASSQVQVHHHTPPEVAQPTRRPDKAIPGPRLVTGRFALDRQSTPGRAAAPIPCGQDATERRQDVAPTTWVQEAATAPPATARRNAKVTHALPSQ